MQKLVLALATLLVTVRVFAKIEDDVAKAAAIENSVERLAAYDLVAAKYRLAPQSNKETKKAGKWVVTTTTSPIDDSKTVICNLQADATVNVGRKTIHPTLTIRFMENELSAYINYGIFLGSDTLAVTHRIDRNQAETTNWGVSTNREAAFYGGNIGDFISQIEKAETLIVRLTPYGESPVTVTFTPSGFEKGREAIRNAIFKDGGKSR